jgi:hypothetical protein
MAIRLPDFVKSFLWPSDLLLEAFIDENKMTLEEVLASPQVKDLWNTRVKSRMA